MKTKNILWIACFLSLLSSCSSNKSTNTSFEKSGRADNTLNYMNVAGTYKGNIPCNNCENAIIKLNTNETYLLSIIYASDPAEEHSGKYYWSEDGNSITLNKDNLLFKVEKDKITLLNKNGKIYEEQYILKKIE